MDEFDDVNDGKRPNNQNLDDSSRFSDFLHIFSTCKSASHWSKTGRSEGTLDQLHVLFRRMIVQVVVVVSQSYMDVKGHVCVCVGVCVQLLLLFNAVQTNTTVYILPK